MNRKFVVTFVGALLLGISAEVLADPCPQVPPSLRYRTVQFDTTFAGAPAHVTIEFPSKLEKQSECYNFAGFLIYQLTQLPVRIVTQDASGKVLREFLVSELAYYINQDGMDLVQFFGEPAMSDDWIEGVSNRALKEHQVWIAAAGQSEEEVKPLPAEVIYW